MRASLRKTLEEYNLYLKRLGIGMLHKSNLVPVWDKEDAKEIAKMRRG